MIITTLKREKLAYYDYLVQVCLFSPMLSSWTMFHRIFHETASHFNDNKMQLSYFYAAAFGRSRFVTTQAPNNALFINCSATRHLTGLILKAPIMTAADDIHKYFFHCFSEKIRLDVSSESSAT